jgi:hypothetical protein
VSRLVGATGKISLCGQEYRVGAYLAGERVEVRSQAAWWRSVTAACWSLKPPPAIRPGAVPTRGRQPQLRAHTAGRPVLRMVDQRGSLSFAGAIYRRVRAAGIPVRLVLAHPGYANTNLQRSGPKGLVKQLLKVGNRLLAQSAEMGALCELYAAVDPAAEGGRFYGPGGFGEMRGYPSEVQPIASATDEETARRPWDLSEELTGVSWTF